MRWVRYDRFLIDLDKVEKIYIDEFRLTLFTASSESVLYFGTPKERDAFLDAYFSDYDLFKDGRVMRNWKNDNL